MQAYIEQLLEDLQNAQRPDLPLSAEHEPQSFEEHIAEVEHWLANEPEYTFGYHCGLQKEAFPPAERLSHKQLTLLVRGLNQLLFTWNINVDIPDKLTIEKTYNLMVSVLDEKVEIVESGFITVEFCTYDVPSCPFEEHCMCKKYDTDNDMKIESEHTTGELPF